MTLEMKDDFLVRRHEKRVSRDKVCENLYQMQIMATHMGDIKNLELILESIRKNCKYQNQDDRLKIRY